MANPLICRIDELEDCVADLKAAEDSDNQTLDLVGCELTIEDGNTVDLSNVGQLSVYRLAPNTSPGVINREWHDTAPVVPIADSTTAAGRAFRLGHDFSLPTTTNTVITGPAPLNLNDTDNTAGELDVQVLDTVITVPAAGGIWIQYQGGSEGYWAIEVGQCCGPLELVDELGYTDREDSLAVVGPVYLPPGQHQFRAWNIDSGGTNSSHTASYSTDGVNFGPVVPAGVEFSTGKRAVECQTVPACDPIPEGWDTCPPPDCLAEPFDPLPEVAVEVPLAAVDLPVPDNEEDTSIRTGLVGVSDDYARADHNHPIRRQANPGDPALVFTGSGSLDATLILDRWSTEEEYTYEWRLLISQVAGNGWDIISVPSIAGFQRPHITDVSTYRSQSFAVQIDDATGTGGPGATPRGPYMGVEAMHWSSTQRIYAGIYRRDVASRMYIQFQARYIRL